RAKDAQDVGFRWVSFTRASPPKVGQFWMRANMVPPVVDARRRGVLVSMPPPVRFTATGMQWADGSERNLDAVIWCTGFRPALSHLEGMGMVNALGRIDVDDTQVRSVAAPSVWLLGYGDWNGAASATLIGVTRYAREAVRQISDYVGAFSPLSSGA
ncbi:hypothetical protein A1OC_00096, partial [Stenotrophomonas maltophilia Ab55555]